MKAGFLTFAILAVCSIAVAGRQGPPAERSPNQQAIPSQFVPPDPRRDNPREPQIEIRADRVERQGSLIRYRGNVLMETESVAISADELDFNINSREGDLRGTVRVKVAPRRVEVVPLTK
jgi:lipopolysaccharide assembly outer membrane protein LptD (OstA)